MNPKIGYLIDTNFGWGEDPTWEFYREEEVPSHKLEMARRGSIKRIVYWVLNEE